jgi:hypothetical protein
LYPIFATAAIESQSMGLGQNYLCPEPLSEAPLSPVLLLLVLAGCVIVPVALFSNKQYLKAFIHKRKNTTECS